MTDNALDRDALSLLPKVELHRHLEGSLGPGFFLDLACDFPLRLPDGGLDALRRAITMEGQTPDFKAFLSKFETLRGFWVDKECIARAVNEAVRRAAEDKVFYLELRYNPIHFAQEMGFHIEKVIEWVTAAREAAAGEHGLQVELIATINRGEHVTDNAPILEAAIAGAGTHFVGIDIAGDELAADVSRYAGLVRSARKAGLGVTIHAGEVGPASNVKEAIKLFDCQRIGHGIRVLEDPAVIEIAKDHRTAFEVCPTSNLLTGVVKDIESHPITKLAEAGLAVTVCTDDPEMCGVTLTDEYEKLARAFSLTAEDFLELNLTAIQASFRPRAERTRMAAMYEDAFASAR